MKTIIHIFTVYLLALSLIPCGDGGGGLMELVNQVFDLEHAHESDHEQHSNNCGDDLCSPFCICSCCSITMDRPAKLPYQLQAPAPLLVINPVFVPSFFPCDVSYSIWQPPRFSSFILLG